MWTLSTGHGDGFNFFHCEPFLLSGSHLRLFVWQQEKVRSRFGFVVFQWSYSIIVLMINRSWSKIHPYMNRFYPIFRYSQRILRKKVRHRIPTFKFGSKLLIRNTNWLVLVYVLDLFMTHARISIECMSTFSFCDFEIYFFFLHLFLSFFRILSDSSTNDLLTHHVHNVVFFFSYKMNHNETQRRKY